MENATDTVTISLETYENMRDEIKHLRSEVAKKTIIEYKKPEWYKVLIASAVLFLSLMWIGYLGYSAR